MPLGSSQVLHESKGYLAEAGLDLVEFTHEWLQPGNTMWSALMMEER